MSHEPIAPVGGSLVTRKSLLLGALAALGFAIIVWRFAVGLGPTTGLSDGYPWGLWIAYDVVTGTALACGGYAIAILVYVLNRGRYHPLVRPAVLTSALGYTLATIAVLVDVGRPWNGWKLMLPWMWNMTSVLLQVALLVIAYSAVLWIEMAPPILERLAQSQRHPSLVRFATRTGRAIDRVLPLILGLGLVLPTMHQSALGSLMMIARTKVHPLWHTPMLPALFLISTVAMGYAAVVVESSISSLAFKREPENKMLSSLSALVAPLALAWLALRVGDLALRGRLGLVFSSGAMSGWFFAEVALILGGSILLLRRAWRSRMSLQFLAAVLLLGAGVLYRFDVFLVAFDPGRGWHYFPTVPEMLVTLGIVAVEILGYTVAVKRLPILSGRPARSVP